MLLKHTAWLKTMICRLCKELQVLFPDKRKVLRGLFFFGSLISLGKLVYFFFKLDASLNKNPDAKFEHESIFVRFRVADSKLIYGQHLTKKQEDTIHYLETKGLTESQIFSLLLGRYIKPSGAIAVNAKLEAFLILLILFLAAIVLLLLVGLTYDLVFHKTGLVALKIVAWVLVALMTVAPTTYLSLLLLKPPAAFYRDRALIEQANVANRTSTSKVINMHNR